MYLQGFLSDVEFYWRITERMLDVEQPYKRQ